MNRKTSQLAIHFEYLMYIGIILYLSSGHQNGLLLPYSNIPAIAGVIVFLIYTAVIVLNRFFQYGILCNTRTVLILSLLTIAIVQLTTPQSQPGIYTRSTLFPLYYLLVLIFASLGNGTLWLTSFALFFIGTIGRLFIFDTQNIGQASSMMLIFRESIDVFPHVGYVFIVSLFSYTVSSTNRKKHTSMPVSTETVKSVESAKNQITQKPNTKTGTYTIDSDIPSSTDTPLKGEELSSVVFFMSRNFRAYSALGFIFDKEKKVFALNSFHSKSKIVISKVEIPAGSGIIGNLANDRGSFLTGNAMNYETGINYYSNDEMINSILAVPIFSESKELLGALVVDSKDKLAFRDNHKDILNRFSKLAAALITNVRMRVYQENVAKNFQLFFEAAQQFAKVQHPDQVLAILFQLIDSITTYYRLVVIDFYPESTSCVIRRILGNKGELQEGTSFLLNNGLYSTVLKNRQTVSIDDFDQYRSQYYLSMPDTPVSNDVHSLVITPLTTSESYCKGLISIEGTMPFQYQGETSQLLATIVSNASVAYQKAFLYQKMEMLATTDGLTMLYNHRTFQDILTEEISRSTRYKRPLSLLLMDIDHFKKFNDTYGHPVGDLVLKEISACIRQTVRSNDVPARYGGEEFTVIIPETDSDSAMIIGDRIRQNIENLVIKNKKDELKVTVSIGCATFTVHAKDKQELINYADIAMYFSKQNGRNQINLYNKKMKVKEGP